MYRSEYISEHLNPYWREFALSAEHLCYCDEDWPLRIAVMDYQPFRGRHRAIGYVETTLRGLRDRLAIRGNADREQAFEISAPAGSDVGGDGGGGGGGAGGGNNARVVVGGGGSQPLHTPVGLVVVLRADVVEPTSAETTPSPPHSPTKLSV